MATKLHRFIAVPLLLSAVALSKTARSSDMGGPLRPDPGGWAFHPAIATSTKRMCVAMASREAVTVSTVGRRTAIMVECWSEADGAWKSLGQVSSVWKGADVKTGDRPGVAHAPTVTMLGDVPYVAWYEGFNYNQARVYLAHHDGTKWVDDGGVTPLPLTAANQSAPSLVTIAGSVYLAWMEWGGLDAPRVACARVARLEAGALKMVGPQCVRPKPDSTHAHAIALADIGGVPHLAVAQYSASLEYIGGGYLQKRVPEGIGVVRWSAGTWTQVGPTLAPSADVSGIALVDHGGIPFLARSEQTGAASVVRVAKLSGGTWTDVPGAENKDVAKGWAQQPSLASDGSSLWLTFAEHAPGSLSQIRVRQLVGGTFVVGKSLNIDPAGSAEGPAIAKFGAKFHVAFSEKPPMPNFSAVHVAVLP